MIGRVIQELSVKKNIFSSVLCALVVLPVSAPTWAEPVFKQPNTRYIKPIFMGHLQVGELRLQIWAVDGKRVLKRGSKIVKNIKMGAVTTRRDSKGGIIQSRIVEFHDPNCFEYIKSIKAEHAWKPRKVFNKVVCYATGYFVK